MGSEHAAYPSGPATNTALAELVLILQDDLDKAWTLDAMAARTGFAPHHLAHAFRQIMGVPPLTYVRRLRLERATFDLLALAETSLAEIAERAGYSSVEAFHRAFTRLFGKSPSELRRIQRVRRGIGHAPMQRPSMPSLPATLSAPEIVELGPLHACSLRAASAAVAALGAAWIQFLTLTELPILAWQRGISSPPQGWTTRSASREFRCIRLCEPGQPVAVPLEPWRIRRCWTARFPFAGNSWEIPAAFDWIFQTWLPASGLRYAFDPTVTLFDEVSADAQPGAVVTARIHVPVARLEMRG